MAKRNYTNVQALLPEVTAMLAEGKTQREVAEHFGFKDKYVVKGLQKRQQKQLQMLEMGLVPRPQGRPGKDDASGDMATEQAHEIKRLRMENKLLRDFLQSSGRR